MGIYKKQISLIVFLAVMVIIYFQNCSDSSNQNFGATQASPNSSTPPNGSPSAQGGCPSSSRPCLTGDTCAPTGQQTFQNASGSCVRNTCNSDGTWSSQLDSSYVWYSCTPSSGPESGSCTVDGTTSVANGQVRDLYSSNLGTTSNNCDSLRGSYTCSSGEWKRDGVTVVSTPLFTQCTNNSTSAGTYRIRTYLKTGSVISYVERTGSSTLGDATSTYTYWEASNSGTGSAFCEPGSFVVSGGFSYIPLTNSSIPNQIKKSEPNLSSKTWNIETEPIITTYATQPPSIQVYAICLEFIKIENSIMTRVIPVKAGGSPLNESDFLRITESAEITGTSLGIAECLRDDTEVLVGGGFSGVSTLVTHNFPSWDNDKYGWHLQLSGASNPKPKSKAVCLKKPAITAIDPFRNLTFTWEWVSGNPVGNNVDSVSTAACDVNGGSWLTGGGWYLDTGSLTSPLISKPNSDMTTFTTRMKMNSTGTQHSIAICIH